MPALPPRRARNSGSGPARRQSSSSNPRVTLATMCPVDLRPTTGHMDEKACRTKLTTYKAFSIRKIVPSDPTERPSWGYCNHIKESWTQEEILRRIEKLNKAHSVAEVEQNLNTNQQSQVNSIMSRLREAEGDSYNFDWCLEQLDQVFKRIKPVPASTVDDDDQQDTGNKKGKKGKKATQVKQVKKKKVDNGKKPKEQKETAVITVFAKRSPRGDRSAIKLYEALEKKKEEEGDQDNQPSQGGKAPAQARTPKHRGQQNHGYRQHHKQCYNQSPAPAPQGPAAARAAAAPVADVIAAALAIAHIGGQQNQRGRSPHRGRPVASHRSPHPQPRRSHSYERFLYCIRQRQAANARYYTIHGYSHPFQQQPRRRSPSRVFHS